MGKNSIFDDIGIGATDLGLAPDPDKMRAELEAASPDPGAAPTPENSRAETKQAAAQVRRRARLSSRSSTTLKRSGKTSVAKTALKGK